MKKLFMLAAAAIVALTTVTSCGGDNKQADQSCEATDSVAAPTGEAISSFPCKVKVSYASGALSNGFKVGLDDATIEIYNEDGDNVQFGVVVDALSDMPAVPQSLESITMSLLLYDVNSDNQYVEIFNEVPLSADQLQRADAMMKANDKEKKEQYVFKGQTTKAMMDSIKDIKTLKFKIKTDGKR